MLKSLIQKTPLGKSYQRRMEILQAERDKLAGQVEILSHQAKLQNPTGNQQNLLQDDWAPAKERKRKMSEEIRAVAPTSRLTPIIPSLNNHLGNSFKDMIEYQVKAEPYWFQKIEVIPGLYSPGWSNPATEKLPYFGLPDDLTGMRVLDIGCAEGFFSFEAEKRGAREVIGIDSFPDSIRRFNIVKSARQSNATAFLMNVYDLEPKRLGTFDLVLFYGVFYHLKHPQYALERIRSICTGELLFQTHIYEEPAIKGTPWARYFPHGMMSGANQELFDPTVFWLFNGQCCLAMLDHVGFTDLKIISNDPQPFVAHGRVPERMPGIPPDQTEAPWC
jgi:2-polyprenyl-3-methyl-5-hydroxy-6-metoxy-1,4-benzoquinol methylase